MSGINQMTVLGNVGQIEARFTPDGKPVVNLSIAVSESWKDKNTGQKQEKTEWIRCVLFGFPAQIANDYVQKGNKLYLQGKLKTRKWQDQQGQEKYTTEVVVDGFNGKIELLAPKSESSNSQPAQKQPQTGGYGNQQNQMPQQNQPAQNNVDPNGFDSDVPF